MVLFKQRSIPMMSANEDKGIVCIKIGTSSLLAPEHCTVNLRALAALAEATRRLKDAGHPVIIISSGAVGAGCQKLGLDRRPDDLAQRQALAAVGQVHLMSFYDDLFSAVGLTCSQVLLTLENLADRDQYLNAQATFTELLKFGAVPVVNENDTVATEQLKIGDNDTLGAQVATLVQAEWLFLLTDVDALYTANPNVDPSATPIKEVADLTELMNVSTTGQNGGEDEGGTQWGTGGMATKLTAASISTMAGTKMVICHGDPDLVPRVVIDKEEIGTVFLPAPAPVQGLKRWILSAPAKGEICLKDDAAEALRSGTAPVCVEGVTEVAGAFETGDAVILRDEAGTEVGRALAELSADGVVTSLGYLQDMDNSRFSAIPAPTAGEAAESGLVIIEPMTVCMLPLGACSSRATSEADTSISLTESTPLSMVSSPRGAISMVSSSVTLNDGECANMAVASEHSTKAMLEMAAGKVAMLRV